MIEIYLLEQLYAVYQYETLNQAAKHLHMTQPTLTRRMQKIEREFGTPLFIRKPNRMTLNENGILAAKYAERILNEEREMMEQVRLNATVAIGFCAPGPRMVLNDVFRHGDFGVLSNLPLQSNALLLEGLRSKKYDLIVTSEEVKDVDVYSKELCTEELFVSVPYKHPYTKFQSLTYEKLNGTTFVMADDIGIWKHIVEENMPDSKYLLQDSIDALSQIVISSTIPSFASNITLKYGHENESRVYIPIDGKNAKCTFYLCCRKEKKEMYQTLLTQAIAF